MSTNQYLRELNPRLPFLRIPAGKKWWIASDHHFGHVNIAKYANRPFDNSETTTAMNTEILRRHNSLVDEDDIVILLGDLAMGKIDNSLEFVAEMNGRKHLIAGNHDRTFSGQSAKKREKNVARFTTAYEEVGLSLLPEQIQLFDENSGFNFLLCHFPYNGDSHGEDRYADMRPKDEGALLLHGHTHAENMFHTEEEGVADTLPDPWLPAYKRMLHVGVDATNLFPTEGGFVTDWAADLVKESTMR